MAFESTSIAGLNANEEIQVRRALDLQIAAEMELRRRKGRGQQPAIKILPNHQAYISAFPLRQFIYDVFSILEPGREYKDNWHIDAITELLQAATVGDVRKFVINIPRRSMKSLLAVVMWFCWVWTFLPHTRWLFSSFSEKFAYRDSNNCRKLIQSVYYRQRWGDVFSLSQTENKTSRFVNTRGGFRACFGVTKGTGDGGDFVICDDPHEIDKAESQRVIDTTIRWWHETMFNSVTDPETAVRGIIQQRVSESDLTGDILARELGYEHLCLPMRFEDDHPHKRSVSRPLSLGKVSTFEKSQDSELKVGDEKLWVDPRDLESAGFKNNWYERWLKKSYTARGLVAKGEGEILWLNRFSEASIKEMVDHLQAYGESAQLQQRPIRRGGNFFNSANFPTFMLSQIELNGLTYIRYWDKAGTAGAGDWTVGMLLARTQKRPYDIYILDIIRQQVGYYERMALMKKTAEEDTRNYVESKEETEYTVGIEREMNSAGKDLEALERDHLQGYDVIIDRPRGKKSFRAKPVSNISESGRIKVLKAPWNVVFFRELERFDPNKEHQKDDQIDTMSGGVRYLIFGRRFNYAPSGGSR